MLLLFSFSSADLTRPKDLSSYTPTGSASRAEIVLRSPTKRPKARAGQRGGKRRSDVRQQKAYQYLDGRLQIFMKQSNIKNGAGLSPPCAHVAFECPVRMARIQRRHQKKLRQILDPNVLCADSPTLPMMDRGREVLQMELNPSLLPGCSPPPPPSQPLELRVSLLLGARSWPSVCSAIFLH